MNSGLFSVLLWANLKEHYARECKTYFCRSLLFFVVVCLVNRINYTCKSSRFRIVNYTWRVISPGYPIVILNVFISSTVHSIFSSWNNSIMCLHTGVNSSIKHIIELTSYVLPPRIHHHIAIIGEGSFVECRQTLYHHIF